MTKYKYSFYETQNVALVKLLVDKKLAMQVINFLQTMFKKLGSIKANI